MSQTIQKLDSATSAGIDGLSAYHIKQIWKHSECKFKSVFMKYIQRIINAKIIELQNVAVALTAPLAKDEPTTHFGTHYEKDIKPIIIATLFLRIAVNIAVTLNMKRY